MAAVQPFLAQLGRTAYDELASAAQRQHLQSNIALLNRFVRVGATPLRVNDFECLRGGWEGTESTYEGAYLMTRWMLLVAYMTHQESGDSVLLLACYRAMTDVTAFLNTASVYDAVRKALNEVAGSTVSSARMLATLAVAQPSPEEVSQYGVVSYYAIKLRVVSAYARASSGSLEEELREYLMVGKDGQTWLQTAETRLTWLLQNHQQTSPAHAAFAVFASYYILGESLPNLGTFVNALLPARQKRTAPWMWNMLAIPLSASERPFPPAASGSAYSEPPPWYALAVAGLKTRARAGTPRLNSSELHERFARDVAATESSRRTPISAAIPPPAPPSVTASAAAVAAPPPPTLEETTPTAAEARPYAASFIPIWRKAHPGTSIASTPSYPLASSSTSALRSGAGAPPRQSPDAPSTPPRRPSGQPSAPSRPVQPTVVTESHHPASNLPSSARLSRGVSPPSPSASPQPQRHFVHIEPLATLSAQPVFAHHAQAAADLGPQAPASPAPAPPAPPSLFKKFVVVGLGGAAAAGVAVATRHYFGTTQTPMIHVPPP